MIISMQMELLVLGVFKKYILIFLVQVKTHVNGKDMPAG